MDAILHCCLPTTRYGYGVQYLLGLFKTVFLNTQHLMSAQIRPGATRQVRSESIPSFSCNKASHHP